MLLCGRCRDSTSRRHGEPSTRPALRPLPRTAPRFGCEQPMTVCSMTNIVPAYQCRVKLEPSASLRSTLRAYRSSRAQAAICRRISIRRSDAAGFRILAGGTAVGYRLRVDLSFRVIMGVVWRHNTPMWVLYWQVSHLEDGVSVSRKPLLIKATFLPSLPSDHGRSGTAN